MPTITEPTTTKAIAISVGQPIHMVADGSADWWREVNGTWEVSAFATSVSEVTWDLYDQFMEALDLEPLQPAADPQFVRADAVSRPTTPYTPMDFGMGTAGFPAISMTQFAARHFTKWLSMKTGRFYRLPTEAEWEYACRAGSNTAYGFGDDPKGLPPYAWFRRHAYEKVGTLEANAWGLYDMHGNVSEWVLDAFTSYSTTDDAPSAPIEWPSEEYGRVVRGGSWKDAAPELRCAARSASSAAWKRSDPQLPRSIWYLTDARFVGFRVVHPLFEPPRETWWRYWDPDLPETRRILAEQKQDRR